ncbi:MAG: hypothetical protein PHY40_00165 [Patescibacteria group bacterium]|nr:hypothetical protein [Patescibacteria group bacterium]
MKKIGKIVLKIFGWFVFFVGYSLTIGAIPTLHLYATVNKISVLFGVSVFLGLLIDISLLILLLIWLMKGVGEVKEEKKE